MADRSTERAMTGSMYNRSVRMCKLMYEAITRMLIRGMERNTESIDEFTGCCLQIGTMNLATTSLSIAMR